MMSGNLMQRLSRSNSVEALGDSPPPSSADAEMDKVRREPELINNRQRFDSQSSTSSSVRTELELINTRQRFDSQSSTSSSDVDGIVDARENRHENSAVHGAEQQDETQHVLATTAGTSLPGPSRKRTRIGTITQATVQNTQRQQEKMISTGNQVDENKFIERDTTHFPNVIDLKLVSKQAEQAQKQTRIGTITQATVQNTQRQQEKMRSTGNQVDENKFIERDTTHFPNVIDLKLVSKQAEQVFLKNYMKNDKKLKELFKGTEQQVLYKVNIHLIQHRFDVNALLSEKTGDGPLHEAVKKKFVKVAERLLDNGASLHLKNHKDDTPLNLALGLGSNKNSTEEDEENCCCSWVESIKKYFKNNCGKEHEDFETEQDEQEDAKCDEMAALMISKMKPEYVSYLFGDLDGFNDRETYEDCIRNGPANTRFPGFSTLRMEDHPHEVQQEHTTARSLDQNSKPTRLSFLKIVKDKNMPKTAITILDKLEGTDPSTKQPVVYSNLLLKKKKAGLHIEDGEKNKKAGLCNKDGKKKEKETVFQYIVRRRQDLIGHPVVRAVIHWKWTRKFHRRYLIDFIKFFVSFVAITICAVVGAQSDHIQLYNTPWQHARAALEILMCIFIFESLWLECLQFSIDPSAYVKSTLNWIEFGSAMCLVISIGLRYGDVNAHWYMFAVGYVFWTIKGLKYCAIYRHGDAYKETLRALVKRDLVLFTIFFVALEMLFGGTLLLVLRGTNALDVEPDTQSILSIYYIGLLTAIDGQTPESLTVDNLPRIAQFVINVFNVLTIVVMLNILIAQMTNTYEKAYLEGQIKSWVNRAEAIVSYEKEDQSFESTDGRFGRCVLFGKLRNACTCILKKDSEHGRIPFDKEKLLEEKEKVDEMRAILKQVDKTLLHTDLSVHTIKSKQTAQLQDKKGNPESTTYGSHGQSDLSKYGEKLTMQFNELKAQQEKMKKQQEAMKLQQESILEAVVEIRKLLQKHE